MDHYDAFYKAFLQEMPQRIMSGNDFSSQLEILQENLRENTGIHNVAPNVFKLTMGDQITYWVGNADASSVSIIVDVEKFEKYCKVVYPSKNPAIPAGTAPYASDLYLLIAKDVSPYHMIFTSDSVISGDAERLWQGLVARGNKVSIYDNALHQYVLSLVTDKDELEKYIGGVDKRRYVFVLSETAIIQRGIAQSFKLMEIKRLANWPLFEHLQGK